MTLKWFHILIVVLALGVGFWAFYPRIENVMVFFPEAALDLTPRTLRLHAEDVLVDTPDGERLFGWYFPSRDPAQPVLLFFHGNAGNISHRLDNVRLLLREGLGVVLVDYRGYGRSTGRPSEKGVYLDGLAVHDHAVKALGIPADRLVAFGRSLGAAVAMEVALNRPLRCLILESAFTNTRDMARGMGIFALLSPLLPANYNNLHKIVRVTLPTLIVHGRRDEIVPFSMGERLFLKAGQPKAFLPVDGAGHNDTYDVGGPAYFQAIAMFSRRMELPPARE